ncbi:polysaccharide export protein [Labrys sp. KNU-23]|uniref:polysaccharide biosynthesis/export family protein n=1 Tax=Labrys sp. KNU-23 TaxID=2789216 RepID=UPI0011ECA15F|nr:polysaccharide biosynthesis/export family protein [Labrys sp. KNU-23]QEN88961.1 polysaccharide export protein [Labrys sp. KNU-23]
MLRIPIILLITASLAACSSLPNAGPSAKTILSRQQNGGAQSRGVASPYSIFDVTAGTVAVLSRHRPTGFLGSFAAGGPPSSGTLGIGDMVSVSIFEASSGGLFGTSDATGSAGSKSVQLPPQQIDRGGRINVPYAGSVVAAGRTPAQVGQAIVSALSSKAIEPQVLVTLTQNAANLVTVSGEVGQGGRFPLAVKGTRVLDAIALAGGPQASAHDLFVRLTRGSRTGVESLTSLVSNPRENIYMRADDQLFIYREPRTFTVLGATGKNDTIEFSSDRVTLAEAIGKSGGLNDSRSDASGVFVFRYEDPAAYRELRGSAASGGYRSGSVPVVYRLDMKNPGSFLWSQRFLMRNKDVLYISNAPSTDLAKFLQMIGGGVGIVSSGASLSQIGR